MASNLWEREERFFMKLWNLNPETAAPTVRPEFVGFLQPSQANLNQQELGQDNRKYHLKCWTGTLVCFASCVFVAVLIFMWMMIFKGKLNTFARIALPLQIVILKE